MRDMLLRVIATTIVIILMNPSADAIAQTHEYGSCWIERNDLDDTMLHSDGDSLCTIEFPADCYGGMMSPDSLLCVLEDIPHEMNPEGVAHAIHCEVEDDGGSSMMNGGHMMGRGFFSRPIILTVEYDPNHVTSLGMNPDDLVLVIRVDGGFETMSDAIHHISDHKFSLSATELADWYGVADGTKLLVSAEPRSWGGLKASF